MAPLTVAEAFASANALGLPAVSRVVYLALLAHEGPTRGTPAPVMTTTARLASLTGRGKQTVASALAELEHLGALESLSIHAGHVTTTPVVFARQGAAPAFHEVVEAEELV